MYLLIKSILIFCVFFTISDAVIHDLPSYFPRCKRYDPKLSECLLKATETVKPYLIKGVPELGVPAIEPYVIPEITLEQGTQALNFKALLKNVVVKGLGSYKFSQFDFDVPNLQWFCKATIDNMDLTGDYTVTGKILLAPIEGKGKFVAGIANSNITAFQKVEFVKKRGKDYVRPVNTTTTIEVGGPKVHLDGLFDGNEELNRVTNTVINDNVNELFEDLKPVIQQIITNIVEQWLFRALEDNVPFDKLYPRVLTQAVYYPRCYRDDPDLNQCLLNATEQVRPFLQKGVPELNVPPISPFYVPEVNLQLGTEFISYKSSLTNVIVTGLDTYKFTKFDFDVKKLLFTGAVTMGKINIKGNYSIKGKILTVPIEGKGQLDTTVVSSNGSLVQQAKLVTKKGKIYLESEKTKIYIDVGEVKSKMDGLFDGNEVLAKAADNVIKENLQDIIEEVKPAIEEVFTQIMEGILFKSVYRIPYDKLYPLHNQKS
ncbi:uncharacterized protein LOC123013889 [Tribolium madens]|uniref:uncharacterized protein LOC123013889 n=1 Tax=Tribolium madens TaxID=41895 RepID=UPI001CF737C7|nr:uncharacterized protein LOC123013889 [Tribolium madens]